LIRDMREQTSQEMLKDKELDQVGPAPFLYQAPSATASLIFGDKWAALHSFLASRHASSQRGVAQKTKKLVSETEPAWIEYLLEIMRARGWSMLHPAAPFVTVHNELSQIPEEFLRHRDDEEAEEMPEDSERLREQPFLLAANPPVIKEHIERETPQALPLQDMLPFSGDLPELTHLPFLAYNGQIVNASMQETLVEKYAALFRRRIGGCQGKDATRKRAITDARRTDDLFCFPGVDINFDQWAEEDEEQVAHEVIAETAGPEADAEVPKRSAVEAVVQDTEDSGKESAPVIETERVGGV